MATSDYELQVVRRGNKQVVARWPPGLAEEHDLVEEIVSKVRGRGVGVFKTEAHVLQAVREAIEQALLALKSRIRP